MRIISGEARGHTIRVPHSAATRPSTDIVRSAVFSMLESMGLDWSRVLDLYAGSGALGLEALSRGAEWADFVDHEQRCCTVIRQNIDELGFAGRARVYCIKVSKALSFLDSEYGIIFMDPPYADESLPSVLEQMANTKMVGKNTALVVLHSARRPLLDQYGPLYRVKDRRHGDTSISVYKWEATV
ncbi:MAG: 16S rRNA (guanine(966)-N(2))-methyltransferase RsmD [Chloroflexi bacterium]|nr:16S rRNA (guanine(966)-N(2))-methyltransferase RsmD [Chloroflexota bacterium]